MKLSLIQDDTNLEIIDLLKREFSTILDTNLVDNYHPDYKDKSSNIFYILSQRPNRYSNGMYYVLTDCDDFVCSAGWNEYELDSTIALALTRAYVAPKYRAQYNMGKYILPEIIKSTRNYSHLYITNNHYNSAINAWFSRASQGKSGGLFNNWPDIYKDFVPIGTKSIYYTEQSVMEYKPTNKI